MAHLWTDPAWLAGAHAWIDDRLGALGLIRTGDIEQPHAEVWSTVLRVPTQGGPVWFKANHGPLMHEAALVDLLADRVPDLVQALLASDTERGWLLMSDAGHRLRELVQVEESLERWVDVLAGTARIQLALEDDIEALLALGVPDLRLETLPQRYDALMDQIGAEPRFREAGARVRSLARDLAPYGIRETVQHDDLHDGQVFVRDGRHWVMDWGDACVSHPFFTLSVTLEGVLAWGLDDVAGSVDVTPFREAYLAPYADAYPRLTAADLAEAARVATRLGWACRAVNGHIAGDDRQTITRLTMFVDGRLAD
ncbi:phosphotransferase [Nocardioides sp. cx-173]|uniref:phosphotransferase n=1 Tax=Nocardioides sp. cx-173 TaxID=2898796 RepID=UPI001E3D0A70|nr:phosphotransferase [Nocardioides sp. cx-173]MCD4525696.1 aminoglycoside phosphotransferase family protein [Nocardioides sp. cx-173]UGB42834.1 aminoglycoside phosphotransferase family protein [Nocardioides sp. cx-173]